MRFVSFLLSKKLRQGQNTALFKYEIFDIATAWKLSKYGVISGHYFPVFGLNTEPNIGKYGPGKTLYLGTSHAVCICTSGHHKFGKNWNLI